MPIIDANNLTNNRPPIVVVLGHVDHGKTSLLDAIRNSKVTEGESGGITQHIGAYQTDCSNRLVTFLDTPGHEAFSSIRARGAKVADIAVLVVAADEGLKPQTKEAIKILHKEKTPFVVAVNKIDKVNANTQKIMQELADENVLVEGWGGDVPIVEISAIQKKNIDGLLEMILLLSDLEDLKEDLDEPSEGVIIESHLDKQRGYVATALVQKGVLNIGDFIVVGTVIGKIKSMEDYKGNMVEKAVPSQPVLITGWPRSPFVGKAYTSAETKSASQDIVASNTDFTPLFSFFKNPLTDQESESDKKILPVIFKSDVSSSLEAIESALAAIKSDEVGCRVMGYDVGSICESEVKLAMNSGAKIYAFRVKIDPLAKKLAENNNIEIKSFEVIYELIEAIRKDMSDLLAPEIKINVIGKMKILAVFKNDSNSQIVGGKVTMGLIKRGAFANIIRDGDILTTGRITQLQSEKKDTPEVKDGSEAGIKFEPLSGKSNNPIKDGDILEIYLEEKVNRSV